MSTEPTVQLSSVPSWKTSVLYGSVGAGLSLAAEEGAFSLMTRFGADCSSRANYITMVDSLSGVHPLIRVVLKILAFVYLAVLFPIYEEWFFRDALWIEVKEEAPIYKGLRITSNVAIYGASRLSPVGGVVNLIAFVGAVAEGVVFAALREWSGSWKVPAVAHVLHSSVRLVF
ncbi:MAG: hypothetical protein KR126chlam1_00998 [Chlamydiae bacterium]|nr:hypothetical protein [Chlamydiota bacterium]